MHLDAAAMLPGFDPLADFPRDYEPDVDLFAGGGGASTGYEVAFGKAPDIAINHDMEALAMHRANHPDTIHFCQNVMSIEPLYATGGRIVRALWASPDCTHFSKAKGGKPRDQFIRDLAWVVVKWARLTRPLIIGVENVEEFKRWGPLDEEGQPIKKKAGVIFRKWLREFRKLGYTVSYRELVAADYGAPTTRKRLFVVARLDGKRVRWPKPTHGAGTDKPWRAAVEIINWNDTAPSIFERKKPLRENTQRRIAEGIRRYVINTAKPFLVTYYGPKKEGDFRGFGLDEPLRTQTTENRFALCSPFFATPAHSTSTGRGPGCFDPKTPLRTITGSNTHAMVSPYLEKPNYTSPHLITIDHKGGKENFRAACREVTAPLNTVTAENRHALVGACLVGAGGPTYAGEPAAVDKPCGTTLAKHTKALTTANLIVKNYSGVVGHEVDKPLGTITSIDHHSLVSASMIKMRGTNVGSPVDEPLHTISAQGQHHGICAASLIKYYGEGGQHASCDEPMHTITAKARMGLTAAHLQQYNGASEAQPIDDPMPTVPTKDRFGLTAATLCQYNGNSDCQPLSEPVPTLLGQNKMGLVKCPLEETGGHYEKVKAFLRKWGVIGPDEEAEVVIGGVRLRIVDIGLRMLRPRELFLANGFPPDYVIDPIYKGKPLTITSQIKKCGNAVPPQFVTAVFTANKCALTYSRYRMPVHRKRAEHESSCVA